MKNYSKRQTAACQCGDVEFEVSGAPIGCTICYCTSCQEAGRRFEAFPAAPAILAPDGGTGCVLYRKDRVKCARGQENLVAYRLKPDSTTRRVVAMCCNSAMFLEFTNGHWLTLYRNRFAEGAPPIEMRVMTADRRKDVEFTDDLPSYKGHNVKFFLKLLTAWIAMGLRKPNVVTVKEAARWP